MKNMCFQFPKMLLRFWILDYLQLVSLGSSMIFFEKFHLSHATKLMPNTINKQNYTHGLTSKFMFWVWILRIVGEFDFRTKKMKK
jgi:hypothetical protein